MGQRFINGYLRGVRQYPEGKTARNMALVQKFPGGDEALVRMMQWPFLQAEGHINVESVMQIQGWWVREGWLNQVLPPDRWYDPTFVRRAVPALATGR